MKLTVVVTGSPGSVNNLSDRYGKYGDMPEYSSLVTLSIKRVHSMLHHHLLSGKFDGSFRMR